ncbi:MAG: hypothetical protein DMD96_06000 [Candidatus Rokuibacteriota bacterium]|nr:MAG: hypothetical protein DMD96_06000 [Candidatus Rokubacteria bacterium]
MRTDRANHGRVGHADLAAEAAQAPALLEQRPVLACVDIVATRSAETPPLSSRVIEPIQQIEGR